MATNTILILGGGPRIGYSVGQKFRAEGYQVAVGSRSPDTKKAAENGFLPISIDLTNTKSVEDTFTFVKEKLGVPNIVVYNAANLTMPEDSSDPFGISPEVFVKDTALNLVGAYVALREAVKGFKELGKDVPKVFIATGNVLPFNSLPVGLTLGAGKAALTHLIDIGVKAYGDRDFRFYFASQVTGEGGPVPYPDVSGEAHGAVYWELVTQKEQGKWDVRFLENSKTWSSDSLI